MTEYQEMYTDFLINRTAQIAKDPENLTLVNRILREMYTVNAPVVSVAYVDASGQVAAIAPQEAAGTYLGKSLNPKDFPSIRDPVIYTAVMEADKTNILTLLPLIADDNRSLGSIVLTTELKLVPDPLTENATTTEEWRYWPTEERYYTPRSRNCSEKRLKRSTHRTGKVSTGSLPRE